MSLATDKKRWDDLHAAYAKAGESANEYDRQLSRKYGSTYQPSWLKKGDRDKLTRSAPGPTRSATRSSSCSCA